MNKILLIKGTFILLLAAWGIISCSRQEEAKAPRQEFGQQELLIGLIPGQNIFEQRTRYQHLGTYLSKKLGISIVFTTLITYEDLIDRFVSEKMDSAFFGSLAYAIARSKMEVEPIARPVNLDGTSTYRGYIFVRKESGIRNAADMKGRRFAFVDHATTAGYVFPRAYFRANNVVDMKTYLSEIIFTGSHEAAVYAVLKGEADIGAAENTIYDKLAAENPHIEKELVIIAASGAFPRNCLAVRSDMDLALKKALKQTLLDMHRDPKGARVLELFGARGFIETVHRDYAQVYSLAKEAGLDIGGSDHTNR